MDENDLWALGSEPLDHAGRARPVDEVLRRGRRLRRRAVAARATAALAAVAFVAGAGALAVRQDPGADVTTQEEQEEERDLPVLQEFCDPPPPEVVPAAELGDLRLLPTTLPEGIAIDVARSVRLRTGECVEVDPALVLRADGGDRTVEAEIRLEGPFAEPYRGTDGVAMEPTQVRGRDAARTFDDTAPQSSTGLTWTEADGASWLLTGVGVDDATLRGVAEGLALQSEPSDAEPVADVTGTLPAGLEVTWQAAGVPSVEAATRLEWNVTTTPPVPAGCQLTLTTTARRAPQGNLGSAAPGIQAYHEIPVRDTDGFAVEQHGEVFLYWQEAPGVAGFLRCAGDVQTAVDVADSLVAVGPEDPLIAADSRS